MKKFWKKSRYTNRMIDRYSINDFTPPSLSTHQPLSDGDSDALKKLVKEFQKTGVLDRPQEKIIKDQWETLDSNYRFSIENSVSEQELTPEKYSRELDEELNFQENEESIEQNPYLRENLFDIKE